MSATILPYRDTILPVEPPTPEPRELFAPPTSGNYNNLMARALAEYGGGPGPSPYQGAQDYLMNRPVFDRGPRPEDSMPNFDFSQRTSGEDQLARQQQSGLEDRIAQLLGRIDELEGQIGSRPEPDMSAFETRIAELEQREGPDLSGITDRLAQLEGATGPDLSGITDRLAQLEGINTPDYSAFTDRLSALENMQANQQPVDLSDINSQLETLRETFSRQDMLPLDRRIAELQGASAADEVGFVDAEGGSQVPAGVTPIGPRTAATPRMEDTLASLNERFGNIPDLGFSNTNMDEINKRVEEIRKVMSGDQSGLNTTPFADSIDFTSPEFQKALEEAEERSRGKYGGLEDLMKQQIEDAKKDKGKVYAGGSPDFDERLGAIRESVRGPSRTTGAQPTLPTAPAFDLKSIAEMIKMPIQAPTKLPPMQAPRQPPVVMPRLPTLPSLPNLQGLL